MNKHEEARILFKHLIHSAKQGLTKGGVLGQSCLMINRKPNIKTLEDMIYLSSYINEAEATEKELEELKQKLEELSNIQKRNTEISTIIYGDWGTERFKALELEHQQNQFKILHYDFDKLLKVGKEE